MVYEVDLGLNHVVRKFAEPVPASAHALIAVPGGDQQEGPSGVIVACENFIIYKKQDHADRRCTLPVRYDQNTESGVFITNSQSFYNSELGAIIFLQSEHGDLYKVSLDQNGTDVLGMSVQYFDTIAPSAKLTLLESGYLFAAGDCSNHKMFRFTSLGGEQNNQSVSNSTQLFDEEKIIKDHTDLVKFCPQAEHSNLEVCDQIQNLACINNMVVEDLVGQGSSQIYIACGKNNNGSLRQLTHGLTVIEMATSPMPLKPIRVVTLKSPTSKEGEL